MPQNIDKENLRKEVCRLKQMLTPEEKELKSIKIFETIEQMHHFKHAKVVAVYWSLPDEVETHHFIEKWYQRKTILLPVVVGNNLNFRPFTGTTNLLPGALTGIMEPTNHPFEELHKIGLVIVPGIAFDHKNNRMGRGKGFYDRLLSKIKCYKIGVAFDFQLFPHIPVEPGDVPMDEIIFG
jgi:5-formyltetrahydrofolate cyclo-ligase